MWVNDPIALSVTDRGPGVPSSEREAVLTGSCGSTPEGGPDSACPSPRRSSRLDGEHIWVDDVTDNGARFAFTLPLAASNGVRP